MECGVPRPILNSTNISFAINTNQAAAEHVEFGL
jgi:hypothetical protein